MEFSMTILGGILAGLLVTPLVVYFLDYSTCKTVYQRAIWKNDDLLEWLLINRDNFHFTDPSNTILFYDHNDIEEFSCIHRTTIDICSKYVVKRIRGQSGFIIRGTKLHKAIEDISKNAKEFEWKSENWS